MRRRCVTAGANAGRCQSLQQPDKSHREKRPSRSFEMVTADTAARQCDLFIVLGSSLVVTPAATFPVIAKRSGARLAILNREETPLDGYADLIVNDEIGPILTSVAPTNL